MYIDPSNIINSTAGAAAASVNKNDPRRKTLPAAQTRFGQTYNQIVRRALQWEDNTPALTEQIRSFLDSGQADGMESARHTAGALLQFGI